MRQAQPLLFTDYLKKIPPSFIFEHLLGDRSLKRRIVSPSLLGDIKESFSRPENLQKRFDGLGDEAKKLCAQAYVMGHRGISAPESQFLCDELIESFLVYYVQDSQEDRYFVGFDDLADHVLPLCVPVLLEGAAGEFSRPAHPVWAFQCLNDCALFVSVAARKLIKLTQQGNLVRNSAQLMQRLLQGASSATSPDRSEKNRKQIMHLLMAYLRHESIIHEDGKLMVPDFTRFAEWNERTMEKRWNDFFTFALSELGGWRLEILDGAQRHLDGEGFSLQNFGEEREAAEQAMRVLHYLGYVEACKTEHGNHLLWRKSEMGSLTEMEARADETGVIIMPDFSAILPPESSPKTLFTFSLFGAYTRFDQVYKGIIDKTILNDSLSRGIDPQRILTCLDLWNAPDNVRITIREWIREFSRLFISNRTLIVSNDPKTSMQLQSYGPLKKLIEPVTSAMVFTVKAGSERMVRDMLENMGFDTRFAQQQQEKKPQDFQLGVSNQQFSLTPVFEVKKAEQTTVRPMSVGKYSTELKALELNELFHVIDYAILMGYQLRFEYEGSVYLPNGEYTVVPRNLHKGMDPAMDARQVGTDKEKRYDVRKIKRIGVHPV
ncbi:MAG: hypothetical protein ACOCW2_01975 [Chitinivibrionales bacterium]